MTGADGPGTRYVAPIDGKHGAYDLTVPDLPGCTSAGITIGEVLRNAAEAVRLWINDAGFVPHPRAPKDVATDETVKAAIASGAKLAIVVLPSGIARSESPGMSTPETASRG
jgi:predicted RNase H-like HicB family nuclease